uniref:ShKT domain-containing protein n=1 Tax=Meloidogyne hapla TaxID=6305 RepID=A0A1I8B4K2_MELHA
MFNYLIILFYLTQLLNLTFSATSLNAAINKGPCYDTTTDNYLPNANVCPNEAETVDDPELRPEKLCSTTQNGRFNLIGLLNKNTQTAVTDINKERNENCEIQDQIIHSSRCRKSCKTCCLLPEYGSCKDSITNCQISQCSDTTYALNQCPSTCGKCVEVIRQNRDLEYCVDKQTNCASIKEQQKCVDPNIQKDCALTCNDWPINSICRKFTQEARSRLGIKETGGLGGNVVGDIGTNCAENKELCTDPVI